MSVYQLCNFMIYNRLFLIFLFICNLLGTLYGYYWYAPQLSQSLWYFWPFIPDSPTATLFLVIAIFLFLINKRSSFFETLAFVTLLKYGIWAVLMNIFMFYTDQTIYLSGLILIFSHMIMAIQSFLFLPRFKFTMMSIVLTVIWVFHNDVIDYVFHQYPVYASLIEYESIIGYIAFWLSILPLSIVFYVYTKRRGKKFDHTQ
ncbi:DUF1405 domain-containing protein [Staphylococcus felis]|uniref:DUF1405 domain-containing protein n=1 Tax=Staphylococcus felis TaxID=46127 RepID=UPI003966C56E